MERVWSPKMCRPFQQSFLVIVVINGNLSVKSPSWKKIHCHVVPFRAKRCSRFAKHIHLQKTSFRVRKHVQKFHDAVYVNGILSHVVVSQSRSPLKSPIAYSKAPLLWSCGGWWCHCSFRTWRLPDDVRCWTTAATMAGWGSGGWLPKWKFSQKKVYLELFV